MPNRKRPTGLPFRPTTLAVAVALLAAPTAWAQETTSSKPIDATAKTSDPEATSRLETIVVTVRKRAEASQTVPVAVSAFSADSLERAKISGAADLQFSIPNAVLTGNDRFTIRGIGNNSLGGDNGVGLAVNGASIAFVPYDELFDMDRVEVLRGPQGTLFGRNTTGGALSVFTKRPTSKMGGNINVEVGNYGERRYGGMLNIPINDKLSQRFAGYVLKRDGFTANQFTGNGVDGRDQYSVRSSTRLFIGDSTEANLALGAYNENSSRTRETKRQCKAIPVLGCSPNELGFDSPDYSTTLFRSLSGLLIPLGFVKPGSDIYAGAPNPKDFRTVAADYDATFALKNQWATFELSHDFEPVTLTYTAGYSSFSTEQTTDWDNSALAFRFAKPITYTYARDKQVTTDALYTTDSSVGESKTLSQEVRLASRGSGPFSYTTGLFLLNSVGSGGFFTWHPFIELFQKAQKRPEETWFINTGSQNSRTKSSAWFGESQYKVSESVRATLGARYTAEERSGMGRSIVLTDTRPFTAAPELRANKWTTRASLDYAPSNNVLFYTTFATGYKGGGFNTGSPTSPTFEPETVSAYEFGMKSDVNRSLRTNVSVFYNDYKNMQLAQRIAASAITSNADATTQGIEVEVAFAPSKAWLFDANASLLRTRIGQFMTVDSANPAQSLATTTPAVAVNLEGNQLPHSPGTKIKFGAQYTTELFGTGWRTTARVDYVWQDSYFAREFNTVTDRIPAWSVANAQLRFTSPKGDVEVKTFVKNITNADNLTNIIIEDPLVGRYRNVRLLDPRTYGVQVQYNF